MGFFSFGMANEEMRKAKLKKLQATTGRLEERAKISKEFREELLKQEKAREEIRALRKQKLKPMTNFIESLGKGAKQLSKTKTKKAKLKPRMTKTVAEPTGSRFTYMDTSVLEPEKKEAFSVKLNKPLF